MVMSRKVKNRVSEVILLLIAAFSGSMLLISAMSPKNPIWMMLIFGVVFTASLILVIRVWLDPDRVRASQSDAMLDLASRTFYAIRSGLNAKNAQNVCDMLLPATDAVAVAITDTQVILGYAGVDKDLNGTGEPIRTTATNAVLEDGQVRVLYSADEIGFPVERGHINAAIITPLLVSDKPVGTLKFYYPRASKVTETQQSIARGFSDLISTQIAASALEEQKKLATSMELKALQYQINPHFLFNTINTISSFIRTDPAKARVLLREFATYYRRALEDSKDMIPLAREVDQTARYLQFEMARFGEDRLNFTSDVPEALAELSVPAFMVQPLVENCVRHAMPSRGCLHITVSARRENEDDLAIVVADDGIGMGEKSLARIKQAGASSDGLGIAVRNINERVHGFYGPESHMFVESEEGVGTTVTLFLKHGCTAEVAIPQ
ncbi:MAG: histidine kinase [Eggerthellaceae bacterium]|nr:histidine kinase [Eggerthellaceae bacterium]